jgi:hypothetical protein
MSDTSAFAEFLRRIRAGDARAAEDLVRRYKPAIRLAVRTRLTDRVAEELGRPTGRRTLMLEFSLPPPDTLLTDLAESSSCVLRRPLKSRMFSRAGQVPLSRKTPDPFCACPRWSGPARG